ncbi:MAG: hypothetical protein RIR10_580 [Planctomycetota bacterium]|jgi:hypothetical protein
MTIDPRQLLRRLEPAVRPTGNGGATGRASVADGGFLELLSLAESGAMESAREPVLADGATLEPTTLAQVGRALDLAEGRGAQRAVVVAEGRTFIAHVPSRTLERLETRDDFVFEEVDAAIAIRGESATFAHRPLGPRALPPVSIAEQFETARFASAHGDGVSPQRASA